MFHTLIKFFENHAFLKNSDFATFQNLVTIENVGNLKKQAHLAMVPTPYKLYCLKYCYSIFRSLIGANLDKKCPKIDESRFFPDSRSQFS